MNRLKIGTRLGLAFALVLAITAALAALGVWRLGTLEAANREIASGAMLRSTLALQWRANIDVNWVRFASLLKTTDAAYIAALQQDMAPVTRATAEIQKRFEALIEDAKGKELLAGVARARAAYHATRLGLMARKTAGSDVAAEVDRDLRPLFTAYLGAMDLMVGHSDALLDQVLADTAAVASASRWALGLGAAVSVALGALLALAATRSITRPIRHAAAAADAISGGQLDTPIAALGSDETADLMRSLAAMQGNLARIVGGVRAGSEGVATASAQIAQGNNDLSARTEQQASALQQTAASMEQLGATVRNNADHARQAHQLAQGASSVALRGGAVVGQVVETMQGINASSRKIAEIIGTIDGIAFQTNILALNAAVEAARAGEQGRGFAVVAAEVRTLAQRSAEAAREIKGLISTSVERVEQGSTLVGEAGSTMTEIVAAIGNVTAIVAQISSASSEQSAGVAQVGEAVSQLDRATQQNAALVEQSAAAAESLKQQAQQLVAAVAVFRLARGGAAVT